MWSPSDQNAQLGYPAAFFPSHSSTEEYASTSSYLNSSPDLSGRYAPVAQLGQQYVIAPLTHSSSSSSSGNRNSITPSSSSVEANSPNSPGNISSLSNAKAAGSFAVARKGTRFERDPALHLNSLLNISQGQEYRRPSESISVALLSPMHSGLYQLHGQSPPDQQQQLSDEYSHNFDFPSVQSQIADRAMVASSSMSGFPTSSQMSPPIVGSHLIAESPLSQASPSMSFYSPAPAQPSVLDDPSQLPFHRAMSAHDLKDFSGGHASFASSSNSFGGVMQGADSRLSRRRAATSMGEPQWMTFQPPSLPSVLRPSPSQSYFPDQNLINNSGGASMIMAQQQHHPYPQLLPTSPNEKPANAFKSPAKVLAYQARVRLQRGALNDVIADLNWAFREATYPGSPGREIREALAREGMPTETSTTPTVQEFPKGLSQQQQQKQQQIQGNNGGAIRPNLLRTTSAPMFSVLDYSPYARPTGAQPTSVTPNRSRSSSGANSTNGESAAVNPSGLPRTATAEEKLALRRSQQNAHKQRVRALEVNNIHKLLGLCQYMISNLASAGLAPVAVGSFHQSLGIEPVAVHPDFGRAWADFRRVLIEHQRSWDLFLAAERRLAQGAGVTSGLLSATSALAGPMSPLLDGSSHMSPTTFSITLMALTQG